MSLNCSHQRAFVHSQMICEYGESRWMMLTGKTDELGGLSQCPFFDHKSHMDWPGAKPGLRGERQAITSPKPWHGPKSGVSRTQSSV
jgi:hypothetical protein